MFDDINAVFSRVRTALRRRGRAAHEVDDLMQEAWLRLALYEKDGPVAEPEAFLMRVALNLSIDAHRRQLAHGEEVDLDEVVLVDPQPDAEATVLGKERLARLTLCLARLTDRTREIFIAHRVDGLSFAEIARVEGISTKVVEKHVSRAALQVASWMHGW